MSTITSQESQYSTVIFYSRPILGVPEVQKSHDDPSDPSHQRALSHLYLLEALEVPVLMQSI